MARWLACTVLAAFILGDAAGAQEGRDRYWVDAVVLGWKIGNAPQPTPLVTAGSLAAPLPGALGQPGTSVQIGGTSVSLPMELGGRLALGTWIERAAGLGIEIGGFVLTPATTRHGVDQRHAGVRHLRGARVRPQRLHQRRRAGAFALCPSREIGRASC